MEKVSIVMPCFNDGAYILEAIDSVLAQTYKNIEIVVVDDGSDEEDTIKTIDSLTDYSEKIKVYRTKNLKPAAARNFAIEHSQGTYILPVDADDKIDPTYVEKAVQEIEGAEDIGAVYCEAELFGEKNGPWDLPKYSFNTMMLDNIVFVTALFKKEDWAKVGKFRTTMVNGMEDYDFWLAILSLGKRIVQIPETLFFYRIKKVSRTVHFQKSCEQVQATYRDIYYNNKAFFDSQSEVVICELRKALIEKIFICNRYEAMAAKIKKIPVLGSILQKMYHS